MQGFKQGDSRPKQKPQEIPLSVEELSDEKLIQALTLGDLWSLEAIYERYAGLLYSIAYRMVTDHHIAEDLLQETFVSIWQNAGSYSAKSGGVRNWLVAIVRHRTIDYLRKLRSHQDFKAIPIDELIYDNEMALPDVWEAAWQSIQGAQIREVLKMLSKEQRMVIELAYFQGWTQTEIAEGYRIPLGTVKARMRLGMMRMKQMLEQMGGGK